MTQRSDVVVLRHVVDRSVLTRFKDPVVREVVEPLATAGRLARAGVSGLIASGTGQSVEWVVPGSVN